MPADSQDLRNRLLQNDDKFRSLTTQHRDLEAHLHELSSKPHLTESEQLKEVTLKLKQRKLQLKDGVEEVLRRHRDISAQPALDTAPSRHVAQG